MNIGEYEYEEWHPDPDEVPEWYPDPDEVPVLVPEPERELEEVPA